LAFNDALRANIKLRICLRVNTPEDSSAVLNLQDAMSLPNNIPGRGYIQTEAYRTELIQIAHMFPQSSYTNSPSSGEEVFDPEDTAEIPLFEETSLVSVCDILVNHMNQIVREYSREITILSKPWPDQLPRRMFLEDLEPRLTDWLSDDPHTGQWYGIDWQNSGMTAVIGLIDRPAAAQQYPFEMDLSRGHLAVFGASGWGKTTLLRTVITSLVSTHSPEELHIYVLDFGGPGLGMFRVLPHMGTIIGPFDTERVQRLLRRLQEELEQRKIFLGQAARENLKSYNAWTDNPLPALLLVIDNFAEFRENYPDDVDGLTALAREGRAFGLHIIISAEQTGVLPAKLYNQLTLRLALRLNESEEYVAVVGSSALQINDIPGRGVIRIERSVLEFQIALPTRKPVSEENTELEESIGLESLAQMSYKMKQRWTGRLPEPIEQLRNFISLEQCLMPSEGKHIQITLGMFDHNLKSAFVRLREQGPHFVVTGAPLAGKTMALRTCVLALTAIYSPQEVALVMIDFQSRLFRYGGAHTLDELPHTLAAVNDSGQIIDVVRKLEAEFAGRRSNLTPGPDIYVLLDNYDDLDFTMRVERDLRDLFVQLGGLARKYGQDGLHFIVSGTITGLNMMPNDFIRQVLAPRFGLVLDASEAPSMLGFRLRPTGTQEFPPGRGYLVRSGKAALLQVATPQDIADSVEHSLDMWVEKIYQRYPERSSWSNTIE